MSWNGDKSEDTNHQENLIDNEAQQQDVEEDKPNNAKRIAQQTIEQSI